jgi:gas vesicle protein
MDEHVRTVRAAQQVDKRIGFYVHLVVYLLVCGGLAAVNWFGTPEVWWAQWPFLGWGVAVVFHGLCAFDRGSNIVADWRLRKIRELAAPEASVGTSKAASSPTKLFGLLLLGILIGGAAGGSYAYVLLQDARSAKRSGDAFEKTAKEQDAQLKQLTAEKASLEATAKETKDQLRQVETSKQATEQTLKEVRDRLTQAEANIISDHIRRQGYDCDEPRHAERDEQASRPNGAVWTLSCRNAKYRVTLIPDMAANVELIK